MTGNGSGSVKTEDPRIQHFCRLCLKEEGGIVEIFDNSSLSLPIRIMACASIEVKENDSLPKMMCWDCRVQLEKSYFFRKRCKIADAKLHKHFRLVNAGKRSKVFVKKEDEEYDDDDDYELEESHTFLEKVLEDEKRAAEVERHHFAEKLKEQIRLEETERIFTEARNFINAKTSQPQHVAVSSSETPSTSKSPVRKSSSKAKETVQVEKVSGTSPSPTLDTIEATTKSDYYPELFKNLKEDFNEETGEDGESEYYVIKRIEDDDTRSTPEEEDEEVIIAEFHDDTEDGDSNIHTLTLDSIDCSQEQDSEQPEQTAEDTVYVHKFEQEAELKSEEDVESMTSTFHLKKTSTATKSNKLKLKQYGAPKAMSSVKISQTGQENIYVMEIDEGTIEEHEIELKKDDGSPSRADEVKIFKCEQCPQAFSRRALLQRHQSVHVKNKGYSCEHCEKWFACKSSLDRHTRVHTGEKPFECEECGKRFIQKEILKRHMIIHTGIRPHKCSHCDKTFAQKQLLRQHINLKHTENPIINMHKCFLCPKVFFHASGLSRHLLIHYGVSFKCNLCNKKFNDKSAVKRHTTTVHSGTKIEPADDSQDFK